MHAHAEPWAWHPSPLVSMDRVDGVSSSHSPNIVQIPLDETRKWVADVDAKHRCIDAHSAPSPRACDFPGGPIPMT